MTFEFKIWVIQANQAGLPPETEEDEAHEIKQVPELHLATTASFALIWKSIWLPYHMSKLSQSLLAHSLNAEF